MAQTTSSIGVVSPGAKGVQGGALASSSPTMSGNSPRHSVPQMDGKQFFQVAR